MYGFVTRITGDANKTWEVWNAFEQLEREQPLRNKLSENGYEIRTCDGENYSVFAGNLVSGSCEDAAYTIYRLPASRYACFDVYVANGYDSENNAMNEWLATNKDGYVERLNGTEHYCVEFYDERFNGNEAGSIVEIWVPIEKKNG